MAEMKPNSLYSKICKALKQYGESTSEYVSKEIGVDIFKVRKAIGSMVTRGIVLVSKSPKERATYKLNPVIREDRRKLKRETLKPGKLIESISLKNPLHAVWFHKNNTLQA